MQKQKTKIHYSLLGGPIPIILRQLRNKISENPTLQFAQDCGMQLEFVTRENYRQKTELSFLENLRAKLGAFYVIPEGGTNELAIKGCEEILTVEDAAFDYICCPIGTGGTISGIINSLLPHQKVLGFPALKGEKMKFVFLHETKTGK
jgi:1-aminocyclopropane-1-carboxylate deaminase